MIHVTEAAAEKINELLVEENKTGAGLRVFVQGGGCSGFQYGFQLDDQLNDDDVTFARDGAVLVTDETSLDLIAGSEIDFIEDLMGAYFQVKNPNATSSCGCGTSFSVG